MQTRFIRAALAAVSGMFAVMSAQAAPRDTPAHRAFDFWLGEWQVRTPDGKLAGTNRIEREYGGCVLHERYTTDASGGWVTTFDGLYTRR